MATRWYGALGTDTELQKHREERLKRNHKIRVKFAIGTYNLQSNIRLHFSCICTSFKVYI